MIAGIDHLVVAVASLESAAAELEERLGLAVGAGGRHPALGTENRLAWLGDSYVELIAIVDPRVAAGSWLGAPVLAALERGGGLATWAIATDAIDADVAELRANGADYPEPIDGERIRPDGRIVRWRLAAGPRLGPNQPFLIEHDVAAAEWTDGERVARANEAHPIGGPVRLVSLEIPVAGVQAAGLTLLRTANLRFRPSLAGHGARDASLGRQIVRLTPMGRGGDVAEIGLASPAGDGRAVEAFGCRWTVRRSA